MPIAILKQTISRILLWVVLISMDVVGPLIFFTHPQDKWIYAAWLILSIVAFLYVHLFENDDLVRDIREILLYGVFVNFVAFCLFISNEPTMKFHLALTTVMFVMKYLRIVWPYKTADGQHFSAWPVFGLLGWWERRKNPVLVREAAPTLKQVHMAYLAMGACLLVGILRVITNLELKLAYFSVLPLLVAPALYKRIRADIQTQHDQNLLLQQQKLEAEKAAARAEAKAEAERLLALAQEQSNRLLAAKNEELAEKNEKIEALLIQQKADQEKVAFYNEALLHATHDLQHPMAVVREYAQLTIASGRNAEEAENFDDNAENLTLAIAHCTDSIDATIHGALVATGAVPPAPRAVAIELLLQGFVREWFSGPQRRGTDFLLSLPRKRRGLLVYVDFHSLSRILHNLIANAIHITPPENGVYLVTRRRRLHCTVEIRDMGPGIEEGFGPDPMANFTAFALRLNAQGRRLSEGGGRGGYRIGMSSVAQLCQANGITMRLSSVAGRGSCFAFDLPLADPAQVEEARRVQRLEKAEWEAAAAQIRAAADVKRPHGRFYPED